jgi:hypothetical protein
MDYKWTTRLQSIWIAFFISIIGCNEVIVPEATPPDEEHINESMYKSVKFFRGTLAFSELPLLNRSADLNFTVNPVFDVSDVEIQFSLPHGMQLVEGPLVWNGNIVAHEEIRQSIRVKIVKTGNYEVKVSVKGIPSGWNNVSERYYIYLTVSESDTTLNQTPVFEGKVDRF